MVVPLALGAARVAAGQAAKKLGGTAAQRGIAQQVAGSAGNENTEQEKEFPWAEWAFLTVVVMLIDAVVIILRPLDILFGIGTIIASPLNALAMISCVGWSVLRLGKPSDGIWKKIPKWRFIGATATSNTPFNVFIPAWTSYMLSLLLFH